jgi:hypothetical protein
MRRILVLVSLTSCAPPPASEVASGEAKSVLVECAQDQDALTRVMQGGTKVRVSFSTTLGNTYDVEKGTSATGPWTVMETVAGTGNREHVDFAIAPRAQKGSWHVTERFWADGVCPAGSVGTGQTEGSDTDPTVWARPLGGADTDIGYAVTTDASGDVYVAGMYRSTADFGGGTFTSAGSGDLFLAKYTAGGEYVWSKSFGSTGTEVVRDIAVSDTGDIYLTGFFQGTGNVGGGPIASAGIDDLFVAKYSSTGAHVWSKVLGGSGDDVANSLAVDTDGSVIVTGSFQSGIDFGDGTVWSVYAGRDAFLAKYTSTGERLWSETFWGDSDDTATGVALDSGGNIVLTGTFLGSLDLGGDVLMTHYLGCLDFFLAKFDGDGNALWSDGYGSSTGYSGTTAAAVTIDGSDGIAVVGLVNGSADLGGVTVAGTSASLDVFLARFGADGDLSWARSFPGIGTEIPYGLASNAAGDLAITGYFPYDIDLGGGKLTTASVGIPDGFVATYSAAGTHLSSERFGGTGGDYGLAVAADESGHVVVTGMFSGTADLAGESLVSAGSYDAFVGRMASE